MTLTQSVRCMVMPRALVTRPSSWSPGMGRQHLGKRPATSGRPRETIAPLDPAMRRKGARAREAGASGGTRGADRGGRGRRGAGIYVYRADYGTAIIFP